MAEVAALNKLIGGDLNIGPNAHVYLVPADTDDGNFA
jgi:hypothetical protein